MSKYECPRCGSGVKPNDIQCDRCGEMLKLPDQRKSREGDMPSNIVIDKVIAEEQTSIRLDSSDFTSLSKLRKILDEKDKGILRAGKGDPREGEEDAGDLRQDGEGP